MTLDELKIELGWPALKNGQHEDKKGERKCFPLTLAPRTNPNLVQHRTAKLLESTSGKHYIWVQDEGTGELTRRFIDLTSEPSVTNAIGFATPPGAKRPDGMLHCGAVSEDCA